LGCKIITLNLPRDLTEEELKVLFEPHGEILSCDLVLDKETGVSKGFGFVEMGLESEAKIAIKTLHETRLKKKKIRVKLARED
jgi:RNA recognition motif-containing protein|tara:strand:- start:84 stop:332 length:249 start_codon:yes stop_codon:yes gene_type:complete